MPKQYQPRIWKTAPCTHCGEPVKITKPSKSGNHYCSESECQSARSKVYYAERTGRLLRLEQDLIEFFIHALAHRQRIQCPRCGLVNALPGYKHPDPADIPCAGVGDAKMGKLAREIVDAVWPKADREYVEVAP